VLIDHPLTFLEDGKWFVLWDWFSSSSGESVSPMAARYSLHSV
jgi:hypothetical protein